jgi:type III pantothenate kinase
MNLVIDIGNTAVKTGLFNGDELLEKQHQVSVSDLKQLINARKPLNVIASSTGNELFEDEEWNQINIIQMNPNLRFPFTIKYATPNTLGADRLAAIAGAQKIFPGENVLVIDMGTCVTYDFISEEGIYYGGAISPGADMRFKAMKYFTSRLPELSVPDTFPEFLGDSTVNSMKSGVMNGLLHEMQGMITDYFEKYGQLKIILTGGSAYVFEKKIKGPIFATPDLVLIGLNVILQENVENS